MVSKAYALDDIVIKVFNDEARKRTTASVICLPLQNKTGVPSYLYLDATEAQAHLLYLARWLFTYNHEPSPLVLGWREDIDKEFPDRYSK